MEKRFIPYEHVTRKQFMRWYEIVDLLNKADGRISLTFNDEGYVDDVEAFLTGCLSRFPLTFMIDAAGLEREVLYDVKKIKTLWDFYNNKITCQGLYFNDLEFYRQDWLKNLQIETFQINPCSQIEREQAIKFLKQ